LPEEPSVRQPRIKPASTAELRRRIGAWARIWETPGLERRLAIEFSERMRVSLGRCCPDGTLRLAAWLRTAPGPLLEEVLCHEAAHAAVSVLHGRRRRPHGAEWRALMSAAGFAPRVQLPLAHLPIAQRARLRRAPVYEHHCPVCQSFRIARRAMPRWRCRACVDAGRSGKLVITNRRSSRS
jgi:predicted SprT family Zn-dependent metalloprotease